MLWMLWLLVIPLLGAWLFLFGLGRAAARPAPKPSPMSVGEQEPEDERARESPAVQRRFSAGPLYRGLSAQTGHVRFLAETRKRRARRRGPEEVAPH
jgi:hypothetical protein